VRPSKLWTGGVMGNGFIDKFWGFGDGWDFLVNHIHEGGGLKGEDLLAVAKKIMAQHNAQPHFVYVGSIDAHVSWRAHEPWISKYDSGPYTGPFQKACLDPDLDKIIAGKMKINDRDRVRVQALYDSDISYTDSVIKQLFDDIAKRGHSDDTMVIFTADHGEEMWDHGKVGHGQSLHEELVHVPLVIYYPPYFPGGKVVEEGVDVLDILPTVTDALGINTPDAVQGESLVALAQGVGGGYPRPSIASQYELAHTMRLGPYKLWVGGTGNIELYDMPNDTHEDKNLWTTRPVERRALTDAMGLWMANRNQWKKRKWGVASNLSPGFAAEMEK
jgi:arylsulfatase A-like enzyme